jgi:uncharacterized membrane protein (UPF0127 family)
MPSRSLWGKAPQTPNRRFYRSGPLRFCFLLCAFLTASGCAASGVRLETRELTILTRDGEVRVSAEIAVTDAERAQGLMGRKRLEDGAGMLFVFDRDDLLSFWMKNTYIPLSIAFIAYNGRIIEIRDMEPRDLTPVRSSRHVRYALEVPQGWFGRAGIEAGDTLSLDPGILEKAGALR